MRAGLGLRVISYNKVRLLAAFCGMAVAVVIMFVELGLLNGVLDSQAMMADLVRGDLIVMAQGRTNLHKWNRLDRIRLSQIAGMEGVAAIIPVYQTTAGLRDPDTDTVRRILVVAYPAGSSPLAIGNDSAIAQEMATPRTVLYDRLSRPIYGDMPIGKTVELDGANFRVAGYVTIGPDIVNDGDRKSTCLNSSHVSESRMPSSA